MATSNSPGISTPVTDVTPSQVMREIEHRICGCDYDGTSWTTRRGAENTAARLKLAPDRRLLEIGAGAGWPGLDLERMTKCDVTLVDLPRQG